MAEADRFGRGASPPPRHLHPGKDWEKAIGAAQEARGERQAQLPEARSPTTTASSRSPTHVHGRAYGGASAPRSSALEANRKCVRANLLRGEWLARARASTSRRSRRGRRSSQQDPGVFRPRRRGHGRELQGAGQARARACTLLRGLQHRYPALDFLNVVYQATAEQEGDEAAWRLVRDEVRRNPTLVGLDRLIDAELRARAARAPSGPAAHEEPRALARAGARRLPVRQLRLQGAPVLLAMSRVRRMGDVPAAAHGRARQPRTDTSQGCKLDNKRIIVPLDVPGSRTRSRSPRASTRSFAA